MNRVETIECLNHCLCALEGALEVNDLINTLTVVRDGLSHRTYNQILSDIPLEPELEEDKVGEYSTEVYVLEQRMKRKRINLELREARETEKQLSKYRELLTKAQASSAAIQARNRERKERYESDLKEWRKKGEIYRNTLREIDAENIRRINAEIAKLEKEAADFNSQLNQLYGFIDLPVRFRNMHAVYQIREYLDMQIADTLTGADGAYRLYLDDLRVEKIVKSVDQLRNDVIERLDVIILQNATMISQLKSVNAGLRELNATVSVGFRDMETALGRVGTEISKSIYGAAESRNAILESYAAHQMDLTKTIQSSAYNQYIVMRKENVNNYLFRMLENPVR